MQKSDRRAAPRFRIAIPLHFQLAKSSEPEYAAETLDVSSCGMRMETDAPPRVGAEPAKYDVGVQFHYYEAAAPHRGRLIAEGEVPACA
jgi:hypothetical protein